MSNPGQPDIKRGDKGTAVLRAQRALRRTPDLSVDVDGDFGPDTEKSVKGFQKWGEVDADGIVGDKTWAVPLRAANSTLETAVGLDWADD